MITLSFIDFNVMNINLKVIIPLSCSNNANAIRFIPKIKWIKIVFFHFYFLMQDILLTILSPTLLFGDLVDNTNLDRTIF